MGKVKGQKEFKWTRQLLKQCREWNNNGYSWDRIGKLLGVSGNAVQKAVTRNGF